MTDNVELHVVYGTGPVGMAMMDALMKRSGHRVRMVNRSGRASVPEGVEVVGGKHVNANGQTAVVEGRRAK
jgi:uncharacterized protein YbjT (DUF2867 family)